MDRYHDIAKTAFETIDRLIEPHFSSGSCLERLEIEILPASLVPTGQEWAVQRDGHCFALPKKLLALAFLYARNQFFDLRRHSPPDAEAFKQLKRYSSVMLLYDSEIIATTNLRREYLDVENWPGQEHTTRMTGIENELRMLDSLLTSPLPRHTKSPNLWAYRFWLLLSYHGSSNHDTHHMHIIEYRWQAPINKKRKVTNMWTRFLCAELNLIHEATDKHPRNYYAFVYARKFVDFLLAHVQGYFRRGKELELESDSDDEDSDVERHAPGVLLLHAIEAHHDWCLQHPGDCSGWSFLEFLLCKLGASSNSEVSMSAVMRTLERAVSLCWSGAAVWTFIRTAIGSSQLMHPSQRNTMLRRLEAIANDNKFQASGPSGKALIRAASEAFAWIKANWAEE